MSLNFKKTGEAQKKEKEPYPEEVKVGTHNGRFHADEVIATRILQFIFESTFNLRYQTFHLIRTRDQKVIDTCDLVVDVGKVYDHEKGRYDHHQESCQETFSSTTPIPLSSAGLIWRHFGQQFLNFYLQEYHPKIYEEAQHNTEDEPSLPTLIEELHNKFYHRFIQEIDGHDNGVPAIKDSHYHPEMYNYYQNLHLGNSISNLNFTDPSNHDEQLKRFHRAQDLAMQIIRIHLDDLIISKWQYLKEQDKLEEAFNNRTYSYLLSMNENYVTWREHLKRLDPNNEIKFTVYPRNSEKTNWGFSTNQSIRFTNDIDLLSEEQLKTLLENPKELVFVHKNLFCGAATTQEAAINIAVLSYEHNSPKIKPLSERAYALFPSLVGTLTFLAGGYFFYKKYLRS